MNRRSFSTIILALLMAIISVHAQENTPRQIYEQAEAEYQIGRILIAKNMLQGCVHNLSSSYRLGGYRLLSLCCLALDDFEGARMYAELVLKENPYYTPTVEYPPRFIDLINEIKQGATITTASNQSENVNEAPVPITIITAEMIEELGYNKNLNQILAAYVPGMVEVAANDPGENLAVHGAYTYGQEYVLIMENGHRLNNHLDNLGTTSYCISTEKIDHIEVLRGPASSLYGNVALSAVVNIITKSGRGIDGVKARYGYGSYQTHRADLLAGTHYMDIDISAWASIYNSEGQIRHFNDGEGYYSGLLDNVLPRNGGTSTYFGPNRIYVDSYRNTPAYDLGFTFKLKGFNLMLSHKNVKKLCQTSYHSGYDYDRYPAINGIMPGVGHEETHAELGYSFQLGRFTIDTSLFGDWYNLSYYNIEYDSLEVYDTGEDNKYQNNSGSITFQNFKETSIGGVLKVATDYHLGNMRGSLLAGCHFDHFSINSSLYFTGTEHRLIKWGSFYYDELITNGNENNLSLFVQDKHYITPQLILNAGLRYDMMFQKENDLKSFSPRLALMYVPNDRFSLKLSYAEAFADLAYYYRYVLGGIFEFEPHHLSAIQLTAMGKIVPWNLNYEINLFHNSFKNLMYWHTRDGIDSAISLNKGQLNNVGVEATVQYTNQRFSGNFNLYYCHDISSDHYFYNSLEHVVTGVPHLTLNLHGAYKLLQTNNHELKLHGHISYTGRQLNETNTEKNDYYVKAQTLFDLGVKYTYRQKIKLSLDCENLLNSDHYLCGTTYNLHPSFQRGRTLMASISYQF